MTTFALVDCNNFYASCERLFNPALKHSPIVVLSNNDGCIIARSNEAKALGIPMGAPFYQYRNLIEKHQVKVFSSNYTLYGDLSQRVMSVLHSSCPEVEIYSIDEAFLQLDNFPQELTQYTINLREKIRQWVGIPVSIGIAPTKTLAKVANHIAKRHTQTGVFDLRDPSQQEKILKAFQINNIWGIGNRLTAKLNQLGIQNGWELRNYPMKAIRKHFGMTVERTALELNGISCLDLEDIKLKKNIIASRSFGKHITNMEDLAEAISAHTARATEKLRAQHSKAQGIYAFIKTSSYCQKKYQNGELLALSQPSDDTTIFIQAAKQILKKIYRAGYAYQKAGVMLMDIIPANYHQEDLLEANSDINTKRTNLMKVLDNVNKTMGDKTLFVAAQGVNSNSKSRRQHQSPKYTTDWGELLEIKT